MSGSHDTILTKYTLSIRFGPTSAWSSPILFTPCHQTVKQGSLSFLSSREERVSVSLLWPTLNRTLTQREKTIQWLSRTLVSSLLRKCNCTVSLILLSFSFLFPPVFLCSYVTPHNFIISFIPFSLSLFPFFRLFPFLSFLFSVSILRSVPQSFQSQIDCTGNKGESEWTHSTGCEREVDIFAGLPVLSLSQLTFLSVDLFIFFISFCWNSLRESIFTFTVF